MASTSRGGSRKQTLNSPGKKKRNVKKDEMPGGWRDNEETVVVIPDLMHTGIRTSLTDMSGGNIGRHMKTAVNTVYPASDQRAVKTLLTQDMSQPISTASRTMRQVQRPKKSPTKAKSGSIAGSLGSSTSPTRSVVLVNTSTMEDPFINSRGVRDAPTRVHELVYNRRMQLPHSRRKTRFAREIMRKMKEDKEEFSASIPMM